MNKEHNKVIESGDLVALHYTGTLENGECFDKSSIDAPLQFQVGQQQIIKGLEEAVLGLGLGQKKNVFILAEDAYGPHLQDMVAKIKKEQLPADLTLKIGDVFTLKSPVNAASIPVTVIGYEEDAFVVDANHPLSGKNLYFDIEVVSITKS